MGAKRQDPNRDSEELYRRLVENTYDIPYVANAKGELTYLGPQIERYGLTSAEVIERGVMDIIHPDDRERVAADLVKTLTTGEQFPTEFRIVSGDGKSIWLEDHGRVARDDAGNVAGLFGVLRDISERKRLERTAKIGEARLHRILESSFDTIFETDALGRITYLSPTVERLSGRRSEELVGRPLFANVSAEDSDRAAETLHQILQGERVDGYLTRVVRHDGSVATIEVNAAPVVVDGRVVGTQGVVRDVTLRRAFDEQLQQLQKMEALGTLAGGVAHDFNNILTGILGYASYLRVEVDAGPEVAEAAEVIERAARRAAALVEQLLGFARKRKLEGRPVDVHDVTREVLTLLKRTFDPRVRIVERLDAPSAVVVGDGGQIQQVLLNLAVNARDAMPEGGVLTVESKVVHFDEAYCRTHPGSTPGRYLSLSVSDTGTGIPDEVRHRLFEPFFSTKPKGQGTGMGLATVYGIVTSHGGSVRVESELNKGSTFAINLPLANAADGTVHRERDVSVPAVGREALVVDDDEIVRAVLTRMLSKLGFCVTCVEDGASAIARFRQQPSRFDLVLLDLSMPGLDGRACFRALKALDGDIQIVVSTGHPYDDQIQTLIDEGAAGYIQKPYNTQTLSAAVAKALGDR